MLLRIIMAEIFKGDKPYIDRDGYRYVPLTDSEAKLYHKMYVRKFAPEHRLVMAKHLKRLLNKNEHVHHKDKNRINNVIDNLELINHLEHLKEHQNKGDFKLFSKEHQPKRKLKKNIKIAALIKTAVNWVKPDFRKSRIDKKLDHTKGTIRNIDENIYQQIINDPSYQTTKLKTSQKIGKTYGQHILTTIKTLKSDEPVGMPIILKQKNGLHKLLKGNSRITSSRALKTPVKAYIIEE
jgi:hypothetical protein